MGFSLHNLPFIFRMPSIEENFPKTIGLSIKFAFVEDAHVILIAKI